MTYLTMVLAVVLPALVSIAVFYFWEPIAGRMRRQRNMANIKSSPEIKHPDSAFSRIISPDSGLELMGPCFRDGGTPERLCFKSMINGERIYLNGAEVERYIFPQMPHPKDPNKPMYMAATVSRPMMRKYLKDNYGFTKTLFGTYTSRDARSTTVKAKTTTKTTTSRAKK